MQKGELHKYIKMGLRKKEKYSMISYYMNYLLICTLICKNASFFIFIYQCTPLLLLQIPSKQLYFLLNTEQGDEKSMHEAAPGGPGHLVTILAG